MHTATDKLITLGRFMLGQAARILDDAQFNSWARVGQQLTELGTPFALTLRDFTEEDMAAVRYAAQVMSGRQIGPEMTAETAAVADRVTRRARTTRVMERERTRGPNPALRTNKKLVSESNLVVKRGRGRPRKNPI